MIAVVSVQLNYSIHAILQKMRLQPSELFHTIEKFAMSYSIEYFRYKKILDCLLKCLIKFQINNDAAETTLHKTKTTKQDVYVRKTSRYLDFDVSVRLVANELLVPLFFTSSLRQGSYRRHL